MNPEKEQLNIDKLEMKPPSQPRQKSSTPTTEITHPKSLVVIILLVASGVVLFALYLWYTTPTATPTTPISTRPPAELNNEPESTTAEAQVESLQALSTSDELDAIVADLESTNLDNLEAELTQIETELSLSF